MSTPPTDPETVLLFLEEARGCLRLLEDRALPRHERLEVARKLWGGAALLGIASIQQIAEQIEQLLNRGQLPALPAALDRLAVLLADLADSVAPPYGPRESRKAATSRKLEASGAARVAPPPTSDQLSSGSADAEAIPSPAPEGEDTEPSVSARLGSAAPGPHQPACPSHRTRPTPQPDSAECWANAASAVSVDLGALGPGSGFDAEEARLLRQFFLDEAYDHLDKITSELSECERRKGRPLPVTEILRTTHSLKGSAATVGLAAVSKAAHCLEGLFTQVRAGRLQPEKLPIDLLIGAVDTLREIVQTSENPAAVEPFAVRLGQELVAIEHIAKHSDGLASLSVPSVMAGKTAPAPASTPPSTPTPVSASAPAPASAASTASLPGESSRRIPAPVAVASDHPRPSQHEACKQDRTSMERSVGYEASDRLPAAQSTTNSSGSSAVPGVWQGNPSSSPVIIINEDLGGVDERRRRLDRRQEDTNTLRVDAIRLDELNDHIAQLVVDRTRIERRVQELKSVVRGLSQARASLKSLIPSLRARDAAPTELATLAASFEEIEAQLAGGLSNLLHGGADLLGDTDALRRTTSTLQHGFTQIRMLPMRHLFRRRAGPVREAARMLKKRVELVTSGEEIQIDKAVVDKVTDPLIQILRNAVAHGIESSEVRAARGKPPAGRVSISARHQGDSVFLEVADDGAGIDSEALRRALVANSQMTLVEARAASEEQVMARIFEAGVSSRIADDEVAGRGVGLDAVRETITRLGGDITVASSLGAGTRFAIRLPLTTAIAQALLFKVGANVYAIPSIHVTATLSVATGVTTGVAGVPASLCLADEIVPLVCLQQLLGSTVPADSAELPVAVLEYTGQRFGCTCDKMIGVREIVVKNLGPLLAPLGLYAGATISGAGKVQLILDPAALARTAWPGGQTTDDPSERPTATSSTPTAGPQSTSNAGGLVGNEDAGPVETDRSAGGAGGAGGVERTGGTEQRQAPANVTPATTMTTMTTATSVEPDEPRLLLVDDSPTIRKAVTSMLASNGYAVDSAADGAEAWKKLHEKQYRLLVTDLEMPHLDGYQLMRLVRRSPLLRSLPIVVISSRSSLSERKRAEEFGAQAFLAKPMTDKALGDCVGRLLTTP
ncbi:MAG: response regulator [Pseudomonadota bacterium]